MAVGRSARITDDNPFARSSESKSALAEIARAWGRTNFLRSRIPIKLSREGVLGKLPTSYLAFMTKGLA